MIMRPPQQGSRGLKVTANTRMKVLPRRTAMSTICNERGRVAGFAAWAVGRSALDERDRVVPHRDDRAWHKAQPSGADR